MTRGVEVLTISDDSLDAEIDALLARCPTSFAQQTPTWRDVITSADVDEPAWLGCRVDGALTGVLPAFRFAGPQGAILTSVPQAGPLGGIACAERDREAVFEALLAAFLDRARALDCDLATLISNPFWPDRHLYDRLFAPDYVLENVLLALDLEEDVDEAGLPLRGSATLRRNLRRAGSGTLRVDEEQSAANVDEWYEIHARRHREIGATPLPRELIRGALEQMVPRGRARFFFVRVEETGEMASGGLYLRHGLVTDAFMPSMDSRFAKLRPNYLLGAHSIAWARKEGCRFYNWQGSPPGSGVDRFKRQWGSHEYDYAFLTWVTGDASRFRCASVAEIQDAYRWHYVLPFDLLGADRREGGRSSRGRAWSALAEKQSVRRAVVEHYERQLARHGPSARGMDWKDADSQRLRFELLCEGLDLEGRSLHEVGAGAGHLCDFLRERGIGALYSGSDLSTAMLAAARAAHPDIRFEARDALAESPSAPWDVVVCSGLFHVKLDTPEAEWRTFVEDALRRMYADCRSAIAFNMMSDRVDFRTEALFYSSPEQIVDFCRKELSPNVVLRHDYPLYEYTVHVHRS